MNTITTRPTEWPASDRQRSYIESLLAQRDTSGTAYAGWVPDWSRSTRSKASDVIDFLVTLPKKTAAPAPAREFEAGIYRSGDHLVRVYEGQKSGAMLVKQVDRHSDGPLPEDQYVSYTYLGAASRVLDDSYVRLSMEEVGALGVASNHCLICGRRLDDPESVDRGIGPVCASRY